VIPAFRLETAFGQPLKSQHPGISTKFFVLLAIALLSVGQGGTASDLVSRTSELKESALDSLPLPEGFPDGYSFNILLDGQEQELSLSKRSVRSKQYQVLAADGVELTKVNPPEVSTYRGTLSGFPESSAALTRTKGGWVGQILCGDKTHYVEPLEPHAKATGYAAHLIYEKANVLPLPASCGVDGSKGLVIDNGGSESLKVASGMKVCEIAIDADYDFYLANGSNMAQTVADVESVINAVSSIYENDVEVAYEITTILVRTDSNDPYSETSAIPVLQEFQDYWNNNHTAILRDTAHLFTGRNIVGSTIGIAYIGVICHPTFGYGVSQTTFSTNFARRAVLTAHELGHNWNASHCNSPVDPNTGAPNPNFYQNCCNGDGAAYNMCSSVGSTVFQSFCQPSIDVILAYKSSRFCLSDPVGGPQPTKTNTSPPAPTSTFSPTNTPVPPTAIPTASETPIPSDTRTATAIPTDTETSTSIPTSTQTSTGTNTSTPIPSDTPTPSSTHTKTNSVTPTASDPPTSTSSPTASDLATPSNTPIPTDSPTATGTATEPDSPTPVTTDDPTPTPVTTDDPTPTPVTTDDPTPTPVTTDDPTPTPVTTDDPTPTPVTTDDPTQPPTSTPTPVMIGDLNGDGNRNAMDCLLFSQRWYSPSKEPDPASLNGDGLIDCKDLMLLLEILAEE